MKVSTIKNIKFKFDKKLKKNYFSTNYFLKTAKIIASKNDIVAMQFINFSADPIVVCGINESIQLLKFVLSKNFNKITIKCVNDGTIINQNTPLMIIEGPYKLFCMFENIIDGILAKRSSVATNVYNCVKLLNKNQEIIFMADRTDSYFNQQYDAYPAYMVGINKFVTDAQIELFKFDKKAIVTGTIPHSLIQNHYGDLKQTIIDYYHIYKTKTVALIDYHNDVIGELEKIKNVLNLVYAVRIDTSKNNIDKSLINTNNINKNGVNHELVMLVRNWLDNNNFNDIKIIVSSGVNNKSIEMFKQLNTPIDVYGIGSYFLTNSVHISADLVEINGQLESKVGRKKLDWSQLHKI